MSDNEEMTEDQILEEFMAMDVEEPQDLTPDATGDITIEANVDSKPIESDSNEDPPDEGPVDPPVEENLSSPNNEGEKTPAQDDWEKRYKELQGLKDRQLAEMQAKLEALHGVVSGDPYDNGGTYEPTAEEIDSAVQHAPVDTFSWAVENAPQHVPTIISKLREHHGDEIADRAMAGFQQTQLDQRDAVMAEMLRRQQEPQVAQRSIQAAVDYVAKQYGDDFDSLKEDVVKHIADNGLLKSYEPNHVAAVLKESYLEKWRERAITKQASNSAPKEVPKENFVENGTPGGNVADEKTEEELIADSIVDAWKESNYLG